MHLQSAHPPTTKVDSEHHPNLAWQPEDSGIREHVKGRTEKEYFGRPYMDHRIDTAQREQPQAGHRQHTISML
eukprot:2898967-Rhodomonas_salina.4